jgi:hypothetical protein
MAFTQFNRAGHRQLSAEISEELKAFAARHGLTVSVGGGQIGSTDLTIKVVVTTADTSAIEAKARQEIGWYGRDLGLVADDYGAEFMHGGERYRFVGVNPNAPKYPIQGERVIDGRGMRFTRGFASNIIRARPPAAPVAPTQAPRPTTLHNPPPAHAIPELAELAGIQF